MGKGSSTESPREKGGRGPKMVGASWGGWSHGEHPCVGKEAGNTGHYEEAAQEPSVLSFPGQGDLSQ